MRSDSGRAIRTIAAVAFLVALCAAAFILDALLFRKMLALHMNDFGKFYYSTRAFLAGGDMYAPSPATNLAFENAPAQQYLNMNPPHFHLIVLPFAPLAPLSAAMAWMAASVFALLGAVLLIGHEVGVSWTPVRALATATGLLAFAGTQAFFLTGQMSMLLLLAVTLCWIAARRNRWRTAAVWMGVCLSVKPFVLIFIPYLIGTRRYRAAIVALATAAACFVIGLVVFGAGNYLSWYRAVAQAGDWTWAEMNASALGFFRRVFDRQPITPPLVVAPALVRLWVPVAAGIGAVTLLVAIRDRTAVAIDRAFALLLVAAVLISPLGWIYYVPIVAGPAAAVVLSTTHRRTTMSMVAGAVAVVGLLWPHPLLAALQPNRWATLLNTSAYFWGTLAAWTWLVLDARSAAVRSGRAITDSI